MAAAGGKTAYPPLVNGFSWVSGTTSFNISAANVRLSDLNSLNVIGGSASGGSGSYSINTYITVDSSSGDPTAIMFLASDGGTHTTISVNNFTTIGTLINAHLHVDVTDTVTGLTANYSTPINVARTS